jgi:hypothetical protein
MIAGRFAAATAGAGALLILAACTQDKVGPTQYVTVAAPPPSPSRPATSTPPAQSKPAPAPTMHKLPGGCENLLPTGAVIDALGRKVGGRTAFVVGEPDPTIGRVGYINCRYGVSARQAADPKIEIGVSLYKTPKKAAARLQPTIDDYTHHAAKAAKATVAGYPATVLTGGVGTGYGPTVVLALGQRTIAVSLRPDAFAASTVDHDLTALAALAAHRTSR